MSSCKLVAIAPKDGEPVECLTVVSGVLYLCVAMVPGVYAMASA
jgi:hypothetical protein